MKKNNKGFTLLEILIAVMVLSICLVVIMQLFSGALKAESKSEEYSKAIFLAEEKMEEFLLMETLTEGETRGEYDDKYAWVANISALPGDIKMKSGLKRRFKIDLKILWRTDLKQKEFTLNTISISGVMN